MAQLLTAGAEEDATNYTASSLVDSLHSTPHYDLAFKPVAHDFEPQLQGYQEALVQMAWPIAVLAALFVLR